MNVMNDYHVEYCATSNCQQHVLAPQVKRNCYGNTYQFWQALRSFRKLDVLQTINDKHSEYGTWQIFSKEKHKEYASPLETE